MPNYNPKTRIAYGVIDARNVPWILDEIMMHGENVTLKDAEDDIKSRMTGELGDFEAAALFAEHGLDKNLEDAEDDEQEQQRDDKEEVLRDWLIGCVRRATELRGEDADMAADELLDLVEIDSGTFDIAEVVDTLMTYLQEEGYFEVQDECSYEYEADGFKYHLGHLGGAPLLWIFEGPYVMWCRACSPCVPGAANNDCPSEPGDGILGYCCDPADVEDFDAESSHVFHVGPDGELTPYVKDPGPDGTDVREAPRAEA